MAQVTSKGILRIIALFLSPILKAVTPMIADLIDDSLIKIYRKALATTNPIDDLFVAFLLDILDIDVPEED